MADDLQALIATFRRPEEIMLDALRAELARLLSHCTQKQRDFFPKVFPEGIDDAKQDRLCSAINLCQRTLRKNLADPARLEPRHG